MPHNKDTPIEVIQADRDEAAAALSEWYGGGRKFGRILAGQMDGHPFVQAFARHRLAHSPTPIDPSDEQVERVLGIFNGGLVDVPDGLNPRGFTTCYQPHKAMRAALTALRSPVPRELREALRDLAEAARNACDARRHPSLIEALAEADRHLIQKERSQ